jgi:cytochrome P450
MNVTATRLPPPADFHPFADSFRADPFAYHPRLLGHSPGYFDADGVRSAYVATYAQCASVLADHRRFSSVKPPGLPGMERVDFFNSMPVMNYSDPPQHTRLRRIVTPAFSPRRIKEAEDATGTIIARVLESIGGRPEFEAVHELTRPIAIELLLGHFMGVEEKDRHIFLDFVSTLYLLDHVRPGGGKPQAYLEAWDRGVAYCREALARASRDKSENLIGTIAAACEDGSMSDDEVMAMMVVLFIGGIGTLSATAGSSLRYLADHPEVADRIRQDPALAGKHYEESLRCDPPVTLVMRFAAEDVDINGRTIPKGMPVYTMISVACHDPAVFANPGRFDIDRANVRSHLAFGQGIHACIGNVITRLTAPKIVQAVAARYPQLHRTRAGAPIEWKTSARSREMGTLPLGT